MKKFLLFAAAILTATLTFAQAKKPTLMVVPSDVWCMKNGYMTEYDNMGTKQSVPDYTRALQNDMNLKMAISTINGMMAERGFPLKDMEQVLKGINEENATMNAITSKNGNEVAESLLDQITRTAKADIIMELTWNVTTQGPKNTLSFILEGKDAYTGKSVVSANGTSSPSFSADMATLLREAAVSQIDNFNNGLQAHFDDLFQNGREVTLRINVFANNEAGVDLETEFDGDELIDIIDAWLDDNTVQGRYSKLSSSENQASYEQVRIPLYNAKGKALDTNGWAKQLRDVLRKEPYNIPVKIINRGLGNCMLIIGEK